MLLSGTVVDDVFAVLFFYQQLSCYLVFCDCRHVTNPFFTTIKQNIFYCHHIVINISLPRPVIIDHQFRDITSFYSNISIITSIFQCQKPTKKLLYIPSRMLFLTSAADIDQSTSISWNWVEILADVATLFYVAALLTVARLYRTFDSSGPWWWDHL